MQTEEEGSCGTNAIDIWQLIENRNRHRIDRVGADSNQLAEFQISKLVKRSEAI